MQGLKAITFVQVSRVRLVHSNDDKMLEQGPACSSIIDEQIRLKETNWELRATEPLPSTLAAADQHLARPPSKVQLALNFPLCSFLIQQE